MWIKKGIKEESKAMLVIEGKCLEKWELIHRLALKL